MTSTVFFMTMELWSSSVALFEQLVQSSTIREALATATESMLATSTRVQTQIETKTTQLTAIEPTEPTQTASPACDDIEGHVDV